MVKVVFLSIFLAHLTCLFSLFFRWRILELNKVRSLLFFKSWFFVAFVCHLRLVPKDFRGATAVCSFEASLFARRGYFVVSCDLKQFFSSIRLRYKLNVKWKPCQSFPFHHICSNLLQLIISTLRKFIVLLKSHAWNGGTCYVQCIFRSPLLRREWNSIANSCYKHGNIIRKYILLLFIGKLRIKSQKIDTKHELHSQKATFHSTPTTKQFQSFKKLLRTF